MSINIGIKQAEKRIAKERDILRQAGDVASKMTTLTNELEKFTAFIFSHPESYDAEDILAITSAFEGRRAEMDALMGRINVIGQIAPEGTNPADIPANVADFISTTGYDDAAYSAQFDS